MQRVRVCKAVVEAINAGVDLLLVAYDGAQFYRIFGCALDGSRQGKLDVAMLHASETRLAKSFPVEQARAAPIAVHVVEKNWPFAN